MFRGAVGALVACELSGKFLFRIKAIWFFRIPDPGFFGILKDLLLISIKLSASFPEVVLFKKLISKNKYMYVCEIQSSDPGEGGETKNINDSNAFPQ